MHDDHLGVFGGSEHAELDDPGFIEHQRVDELDDPGSRMHLQLRLVGIDTADIAGKNGDGQPTLVFVGRPRLSAENEDPLNAISFDLTTGAVSTTSVEVDDEDGLDDSEYVLGMLEDEIGFEHVEHANVLAFKYPKMWHYAVVPLPFHLHENMVGADADDIEIARDWIRSGSYVLHCGNAYFMSSTGEVESS